MHRRSAPAGMTLVEATVSIAILAVTILGLLASVAGSARAWGTSADTDIALRAARGMVEEMRAYAPPSGTSWGDGFFAAYGGRTFEAGGLRANAAGGPVGRIELLTEQAAEQALAPAGTPSFLDLNGDGRLGDAAAPTAGWNAYAARVSLVWGDRTANADRTIASTTILYAPER